MNKLNEYNGHKTRFSDSSFYDEVCIYCGATDYRTPHSGLDKPCPKQSQRKALTQRF